jgi:hypothetical protein
VPLADAAIGLDYQGDFTGVSQCRTKQIVDLPIRSSSSLALLGRSERNLPELTCAPFGDQVHFFSNSLMGSIEFRCYYQ